LQGKVPKKAFIQFKGGSKYEGEITPKYQITGWGTYHFPNGSKYQGEFREGSMHGKGTLTLPTGVQIISTFKNNCPKTPKIISPISHNFPKLPSEF